MSTLRTVLLLAVAVLVGPVAADVQADDRPAPLGHWQSALDRRAIDDVEATDEAMTVAHVAFAAGTFCRASAQALITKSLTESL